MRRGRRWREGRHARPTNEAPPHPPTLSPSPAPPPHSQTPQSQPLLQRRRICPAIKDGKVGLVLKRIQRHYRLGACWHAIELAQSVRRAHDEVILEKGGERV